MRKTALLSGVAGLLLMSAPAFAQDSTAPQTPPAPPAPATAPQEPMAPAAPAPAPAQRSPRGSHDETHWTRDRGSTSSIRTGALPRSARAASPAPTDSEPCALPTSTRPESTTTCSAPSSPTSTSQSVPRIESVAAGVSIASDGPAFTAVPWPGRGRAR